MTSLFHQVAMAAKPEQSETLFMYTFKRNINDKPEDMQTVISTSLAAAITKSPDMLTWYLHSVSK